MEKFDKWTSERSLHIVHMSADQAEQLSRTKHNIHISRLFEKKVPVWRDSESRKDFLPSELEKGLQKKEVQRVRVINLRDFNTVLLFKW